MLEFLSNNWVWILLIVGVAVMHLGHGGHGRRHAGHRGGHQHSGDPSPGVKRGVDPAGAPPSTAPVTGGSPGPGQDRAAGVESLGAGSN